MTTRKKKVFSDMDGLDQSLTDEILEESPSYTLVEDCSEALVETPAEKKEEPEPVAEVAKKVEETKVEVIEQEPERQPVQVRPRPPALAKRKPSKNTPKFSPKTR